MAKKGEDNRNCKRCLHYDEKKEYCNDLKKKIKVPTWVCPHYNPGTRNGKQKELYRKIMDAPIYSKDNVATKGIVSEPEVQYEDDETDEEFEYKDEDL